MRATRCGILFARGRRRITRNRLLGYGTLSLSICRQLLWMLRPGVLRQCTHSSKASTPQSPISLFHQCTHRKFFFLCFPCKPLTASPKCSLPDHCAQALNAARGSSERKTVKNNAKLRNKHCSAACTSCTHFTRIKTLGVTRYSSDHGNWGM